MNAKEVLRTIFAILVTGFSKIKRERSSYFKKFAALPKG
jgi:FtsZ-interacting cell division protein ZipA